MKKKIEVVNINELLLNYMLHNPPDGIHQLSEYTIINEISDVTIDEISIQQDGFIFVKGNGIVNIQYGLDADQVNDLGKPAKDNFAFDFEAILQEEDKKFKLSEVTKLKMDESSFYI